MNRKAFLSLLFVVCMSLPLGGVWASSLNVEDTHSVQQTSVVYVTPYGEKYHRETCRTIKHSDKKSLSKADAISRGYGACKVCKP